MKKLLVLIIAISAMTSCKSVLNPSRTAIKQIDMFDVKVVVDEIERQYDQALADLGGGRNESFAIKSAEVSLSVAETAGFNGGLSVIAVEGALGRERTNTSKITFTLERPSDGGGNEKAIVVGDDLKKLIVLAAQKLKSLQGKFKALPEQEVSIEVSFTLKRIAGGGLKFEIGDLGISGGYEQSNDMEHTITLTFDSINKEEAAAESAKAEKAKQAERKAIAEEVVKLINAKP